MPKSITLGTGSPSCSVTSTFDGLMSRWMIALLVGVLDGLADVDEQLQPLLGRDAGCWSQYSVIGTPLTSSITK